MIAAAGTQSGIWAQTTQSYDPWLLPIGSALGNLFAGAVGTVNQGAIYAGAWGVPVTAPNGLIYVFGCSNSNKGLVAVGKPNKTHQKTQWFFVYDDYVTGTRPALPVRGTTVTASMVFNRRPTLAPNGLMYLFPEANTGSSLTTFNPGLGTGLTTASAQGTISGDVLTITSMTSGTFGVGQTISYLDPITSTTVTRTIVFYQLDYLVLSTTGRGGIGTYKLNSAVPNNVVTPITISGSEFPTCTWEVETFANIAATKFNTTLTPTQQTYVNSTQLRGFILAKDGYMYAVPNGPMLVRMAPKNTLINSTGSDIWEVSPWYNGLTAANSFIFNSTSIYDAPKDENGVALLKVAPYPTVNSARWAGNTLYRIGSIDSGVLHPNGKIYLAGTSRWVFIIDPTKWNTGTGSSAIYSKNTLALRTDLVLPSLFAFREIMLEKPLSTYVAKILEEPMYTSGPIVTIKVTDATYIYVGMTVSIYPGTFGSFTNPSNIVVDSVDKVNRTFIARDTTGGNIIQKNFVVNDRLTITPTQQMIENVKMFFFPANTNVIFQPADPARRVYTIDPSNDTIYAFGQNLGTGNLGSNPKYAVLPAIFPNGLLSKIQTEASTLSTYVFTGSEYPITDPANPTKFAQYGRQVVIDKTTSIIPGFKGNPSPFYSSGLSNSLSGGTTFSIGSSVGKVVYPSSSYNGVLSGEFISIKGYSAFTKYFNYAPSDKLVYEPPTDLYNNLATSLYNSYVNRLH